MIKEIVFFLLLLLPAHVMSETTRWQEDVCPIRHTGYYNIRLGQELIGHSSGNDLPDLRIFDANDTEVPYFLRSVNPVQEVSRWEDYAVTQNQTKDSLNIVVVENKKQEYIDRFYMIVRKAEVSKYASLRGSDDLKHWYVVKQKTRISGFGDTDETLILDFPKGNYLYYEITLENTQKSPLEVLRVGKIENTSIYAQFVNLDLGAFAITDSSDRKTYIRFPELQNIYRLGKIEVSIGNKSYYRRSAVMNDSVLGSNMAFELSAKWNNTFFVPDFVLSRNTWIVIENGNNPPLIIDSIKVFGLNRYVCAYLEEGKEYRIQVGDSAQKPPEYDIRHFQADIPSELPVVETANPKIIPDTVLPDRELIWLEKPLFLWGTITVIGLFLLIICMRMIKEMKRRK